MDKLLSQLRENQAEALPWQQKAIERIALSVADLTNSTQDAIVTLDNHQAQPFLSNLPGLAADIYNQASQISQTERNFEEYVKAHQEMRQPPANTGAQEQLLIGRDSWGGHAVLSTTPGTLRGHASVPERSMQCHPSSHDGNPCGRPNLKARKEMFDRRRRK